MKFKSLAFVSLSVGVATAALAIGTGRLSPVAGRQRGDGAGRRRPGPESPAPTARSEAPREEVYTGAAAGLAQATPPPGAAGRRRARASYRVIGVGDIMMGSDWPTPVMDARVTPVGRSRRSARPRDGRPVPRRRRRLRQCRGHDPHPLRQCQGLRQSRGLLHLPQPAFPRRPICAAPASPWSPTPTITAAISASPAAPRPIAT